jgi:hypothetical protein
MAGIGKNLQFRTFDPTMKELGILYRGELVIISTEDKRGENDLLDLINEIEPVTGHKVAIENFGSTLHHNGNTLLN